MVLRPHDFWIWLVIRRSQAHLRAASYSAIISEWFVDVATKVCLQDVQDISVPPQRNTKPVEILHYADQIDIQHLHSQPILDPDSSGNTSQDLSIVLTPTQCLLFGFTL